MINRFSDNVGGVKYFSTVRVRALRRARRLRSEARHALADRMGARSNLGPTLAAHGAHLVGDPHPDENFFTRSDNYVLAKEGVVAQTISSYGLHKDYHQPSDDIAHIDFQHMDDAIGSLLEPIEWLVNSDFKPEWTKDGRP